VVECPAIVAVDLLRKVALLGLELVRAEKHAIVPVNGSHSHPVAPKISHR
jgi:hypothetical protein